MRIDVYLVEQGFVESRNKARYLIKQGNVTADGKTVTKPSLDVTDKVVCVLGDGLSYVGRGAVKLEAALEAFQLNVSGWSCVDIGASTGGFTDCLLQRGARSVLCVDSGKDQLHPKLRADSRVRVLEQFNAKELTPMVVGMQVDLVVMDVSFISQCALYINVCELLSRNGAFISLIKPQFEAGKEWVGKGGIVKKRAAHIQVLEKIRSCALEYGLYLHSVIVSPITGGDGNVEYLAYFSTAESDLFLTDFDQIVPECIRK